MQKLNREECISEVKGKCYQWICCTKTTALDICNAELWLWVLIELTQHFLAATSHLHVQCRALAHFRGDPPPRLVFCVSCVRWSDQALPFLACSLSSILYRQQGSILALPRLCRVRGRGNVFITAASYLGHQPGPRGRGSHFCTCHVSLTLTMVPTRRSASRQILCILMPKLRNSILVTHWHSSGQKLSLCCLSFDWRVIFISR